jgi:L-serine dehydratase
MGGLIGGEARRVGKLEEAGGGVCDGQMNQVIRYALAVIETNASMGRIVAAPTAGSSGVIPAVLLTLQERKGYDDATLMRGLEAAAAIGYLITRNASVSGASGGCQAEIGSAAAMAAAGAVEMVGGTPAQCFAAASNALTCMMGLVCDPIAGLVEDPCQKRNASAAATALVRAQIALSGVENLVNFDETVAAMDKVGKAMPVELRETALGGIAATPSACAFCAGC